MRHNKDRYWINHLFVVVVMILWGLNVVALKVLVEYMPPATMQALRILTAGAVIALIMTRFQEWRRLTGRELKYLIFATFLGVVSHHLLLAFGLAHTSAVNTSLILALVPLTTSVLAMIMLGDPFTKFRFFGVILGLAGVFFINIAGKDGQIGGLSFGDVAIFLAMFVQAASFIYVKKATKTIEPRVLTGYMFLLGSFGVFLFSMWKEPSGLKEVFAVPSFVWLIFFGSAVLATALGHQLFNRSIQKIGPGETAVFNNLVPLFGLISSALLLKETVNGGQWLGFIFIVLGVLFGTGYVEERWRRNHKKDKPTISP
ncbi:DMT family transporter [Bacillus piscicola]|uniref:DMT family transporter n=1 Tax=Bacillus piscicola TaxID=1632684 RepID=UPI001F0911FA|nr:DMT family transporter [Bacillus piscicola]